jgi:class 3 adenylate cyclase
LLSLNSSEEIKHISFCSKIVQLLRNKQPVPSEFFESVTLLFSDFPAFARITVNCDPMQIIAFLNDAHSLIDNTLPEFDVYKVETVNDSYVVGS